MNMENINKNIKDTITEFKEIIKMAKKDQIRTKIYISVAFECPYEGPVNSQYVYDLTKEFVSYGINEVVIADTIGADELIYQTLEDLISSVQEGNPEIKDFETSIFTGKYPTDIDDGYLENLEEERSDIIKMSKKES